MASSNVAKLVLVTGANGGIGFSLVEQLLAKGSYNVLLGARSVEKGNAAVKDLESRNLPGKVALLQIDAQVDDSIEAAAKTVKEQYGYLDVLVNNAAIGVSHKQTLREKMLDCIDTNAVGLYIISNAFYPLLKASKVEGGAKMINVSSGAGSITKRLDPESGMYQMVGEWGAPYIVSKATENMVTAHTTVSWKFDSAEGDPRAEGAMLDKNGAHVKVFSYCPGFTVSNLGPYNKATNGAKPTSEGAKPVIDIIEGKRDSDEDGFLHQNGTYPW